MSSYLCDDGILCIELGSVEESFDELVDDLVVGCEVSIVAWDRISLEKTTSLTTPTITDSTTSHSL